MSNAPLLLSSLTVDPQLWQALKQGDEKAFSIIFNKYYNDLFFYGLKFSNNETLVKDTIQELFIVIWQRRQYLGEIEQVKTYLLKSFRRELFRAIAAVRKRTAHKQQLEQQHSFELSKEDFIIQHDLHQEQRVKLDRALMQLSNTQREVIYLRFYNGFDDREISDILNIKYQSVRNKIHRALTVLRKYMK